MAVSKRFVVTKDKKNDSITYVEYDLIKGFGVNPKNKVKIEDRINVNKMVIINSSLIETLVSKKCKKNLEKIIKLLSAIDDTGDDGSLEIALTELEKFKSYLKNKYKEYMEKKEYDLYLKKLEILESELKLRKQFVKNSENDESENKGKGR